MSLDKVWLSYIDYRPDPAMPDKDRIALGCILESHMGKARMGKARRVLTMVARAELTEPELRVMDGIGRQMLALPSAFLTQELNRFLANRSEPVPFEKGGILKVFARKHFWSLAVTPPRLVRIERHLSQRNQEAFETVCEDLWIAHMLGKEVPLTRPLRAKRIVPEEWRAQVPPAWQIAHSSLAAPARSHVRPRA